MSKLLRKPPKYCHGFIDRHGKPRWYLRRRGFKRVPLPGLLWSPEFMAAYTAAMAGGAPARIEIGEARTKPGSFSALAVAYYRSADFTRLAETTKSTYRGIIERLRADYGDNPIARLERRHVATMVDRRAATPAAANNALRILRMLMGFALDRGMIASDPTWQVKKIRSKTKGFRAWTDEDIAAFEETWPIGSKPRLALTLLLYTAQRRSDVVLMGPQHVRGGRLQTKARRIPRLIFRSIRNSLVLSLRHRAATARSWSPNMANRARQRASPIGSSSALAKQDCRPDAPPMVCGKPHLGVWPKRSARPMRSWP